MADEIISTAEIAEAEWDGQSEPREVDIDMSATQGPEAGKDIEFHVQMRGHTMRAMEDLIVEAAARQILRRHNDSTLAKAIEAKCIELLNAKATAALERVTAEIIDQPMTPSFGDKKPVTMREFIGLYGREYLTELVDREGKPTSAYGSAGKRMEVIASRALSHHFKVEIDKATSAAIREIQAAVKANHDALIAAEKKRIHDAIAKNLT